MNLKKTYSLNSKYKRERKKTVYSTAKTLFNKLLSIYCIDYINITDEEKEKMGENIILEIYLLKVIDLLN